MIRRPNTYEELSVDERMKHLIRYEYKSVSQTLEELKTTKNGLEPADARERLQTYGLNALKEKEKPTLLYKIVQQLKDTMILVLICAAVLSGVFGEIVDMTIILVVVMVNAILGIVQENKAEKALEALQKMSAPYAKVRRDGVMMQIPSDQIVPGDIVILETGDAISADMRLLESVSLRLEEAALTGEAHPVDKHTAALQPQDGVDTALGDRSNMVYMGTSINYGRGEGIVTATGMQTEMGKIANILLNTKDEKTPLQKKLSAFSKALSVGVLAICTFIFLFSVFRDGGFQSANVFESLLTAISLAVAAIPEGLVVVVTLVLSIGVTHMSNRNAIIRRMTAVETLGCTQVICSDKTGTLTANKMTVTEVFGPKDHLGKAMALCTSVQKTKTGYAGDPTEIALVEYADTLKDAQEYSDYVQMEELPFDSERKMMSVFYRQPEDMIVQFTKGAVDQILTRCDRILENGEVVPITQAHIEQIQTENHRMAGNALRVLAAAYRDYHELPADLSADTAEKNLIFIGMTGMTDPIRPEVVDAIRQCQKAGIKPIMITGDHRDTAVAIAMQLGILNDEDQVMTGAQLSLINDEELDRAVGHTAVYARVQPEHKVRIVSAWKRKGKITAMTGDGVNDAPALKVADIGIGMGITGTDVTKNVADMVLTDDNFASIIVAVQEGRRIYDNIRKAIQYLLSSNLAEIVAIFIATLIGWKIFAPIHILWINLITDTLPAIALGKEAAELDSMEKPPRNPADSVFADQLGTDVVAEGLMIGLLTLLAFSIGVTQSQITGMTMAFFTLSLCEIFHSINLRSRMKSLFKLKGHNQSLIDATLISFLLTLGVVYIPGLNTVFGLEAMQPAELLTALGIAALIIPMVEVKKWIKRTIYKKNQLVGKRLEDTH